VSPSRTPRTHTSRRAPSVARDNPHVTRQPRRAHSAVRGEASLDTPNNINT